MIQKTISRRGILIWTLTAFFFLYEFFARASIAPLSLLLEQTLDIDHTELSLISSAYYFAYALMQVPIGLFMDRFGVKKLLTAGAFLCAIGCLVFAHSESVWQAMGGRFLMGLGSSVAFISLLTIAIHWFPKRIYGSMAGMTQVLGMIGPMLAGAPLAWLLMRTHDNWRMIMDDTALIGLLLTVIIIIFVKDHPDQKAASTSVHPKRLLQDCLKLLSLPPIRWTALYAFTIYPAVPLLGALWGTTYLQDMGYTLIQAASINAYLWLGLGLGSPFVGALSDWLKTKQNLLTATALLGITSALILIYVPLGTAGLSLTFFMIGLAAGGQTLSFVSLSQYVPQHLESTAIGINNTAVMLGGASIQMIAGMVMSKWGNQHAMGLMVIYFTIAAMVSALKLKDI